MNYEEYDRAPGVRATHIKQGALSMKHMHHAVTGQGLPDTLALRWGRVVHLAVLEPAAFVERVSVFAGRRAGGDWVEHCAENDPDMTVKPAEYEALEAMSVAVHKEPDAHWLIEQSHHEVCKSWKGDYGRGKCRLDGIGDGWFFDLKTTAKDSERGFTSQFFSLGYDLQFGWYSEGTGIQKAYAIALGKAPPYDVRVKLIPPDVIKRGREQAVKIAQEYRCCEIAGSWPGVAPGITELEVPEWAMGEDELNMEGVEE